MIRLQSSNPRLSVIIPIYNVEKFLRECLDSLIAQTFKNWEAILVDDGSTDSSGAICDEYAFRDARFRVFHKANGGQSSARNLALDNVRGEYIGFVDSDDILTTTMYEVLMSDIDTYDADIATCSFTMLYPDRTVKAPAVPNFIVADHDEALRIICLDGTDTDALWNKVYRREVFNLRFPDGKLFEDTRVIAHVFDNARKVVFNPRALYLYRMRAGSTVNDMNLDKVCQLVEANIEKMSVFDGRNAEVCPASKREKIILKQILRKSRDVARFYPDGPEKDEFFEKMRGHLSSYGFWRTIIWGPRYTLRTQSLRHSPSLFKFIVRLSYTSRNRKRHREQAEEKLF